MNLNKLWPKHDRRRQSLCLLASLLFVITNFGTALSIANALITGGEGKETVPDPGWPRGAAEIFNNRSRIAWWEGPPFSGGQYTAECRGDTKAFNAALSRFTKLNVKTKQLIIYDGIGNSFWLNPNRETRKQAAAKIDWTFMVWVPSNWEQLRQLPAELNPIDPAEAKQGPPVVIEVYTGGSIRWSDVKVPTGLTVIDKRKNNSSSSD